MEQITQNNPEIPMLHLSPCTYPYAHPPHYSDTMVKNYVQHLTSSPHYYFTPHYSYASDYHNLRPHNPYNCFQLDCPRILSSTHLESPNNNSNYIVSPNVSTYLGLPNSSSNYVSHDMSTHLGSLDSNSSHYVSRNISTHLGSPDSSLSQYVSRDTSTHLRSPDSSSNYYMSRDMHNKHSSLELQEKCIDDQIEKLEYNTGIAWAKDEKLLVDPRIISILEPFRHLYNEREELLKNVLPSLYSKLSEFFKKVNSLILENLQIEREKSTSPTLKRSLSLGSSTSKNERFKVRPIDSGDIGILIPSEGSKDCTK
ncbi:hypothetical protein BVRB_4g092270 [Beta vulgaris subsp. vulgaris]|nr:hypothetical protein BVRB_4g092270 [Beta vulgaris subsp. vulgaris]